MAQPAQKKAKTERTFLFDPDKLDELDVMDGELYEELDVMSGAVENTHIPDDDNDDVMIGSAKNNYISYLKEVRLNKEKEEKERG